MTYDPDVYDKAWFEYLSRFDEHNITAFYAVLSLLGKPSSLLDVGCGTGIVVETSHAMGIRSIGIELPSLNDYFHTRTVICHDLREPFISGVKYSLVISWEVAEHLPEGSADTFCDTLANHTDKWLVFTAAKENQGGDWHLNEQPQSYWIEKLEARGLLYDQEKSERLKILWTYTTGPMHWLPDNVMVFRK